MATVPDKGLHDLVDAIGTLGVHDHLCLIYETQEEQFSAAIPFMKIGLERGEKCVYIVDDNTADIVITAMKAAGMDVATAVESGKLTIVSKQEAYLKQKYFDPDWMIGFLKCATDEAKAAGFSALRVTGEMTWVLVGDPGAERLMEYEAKLNYFFPENDALAICQYNRNRFSPQIIKDVISTHPRVIFGGLVCRNFYYVPPDDFLVEKQPAKEIDRLLANITNAEKAAEDLRRHQECLEELVRERTAELSRMNERFSLATNAARLGVWDWDLQKNELLWDDRMYELYGIKKESFTNAYEAWLKGVHPDDRARSDEISKLARRGEGEYDTEFRVVWPDGSIHYLKAYGQIVRDAEARPLRMTGINFDITLSTQAGEELRESEQRFHQMFDHHTAVMLLLDPESGAIVDANRAAADFYGYAHNTLCDMSIHDISDMPTNQVAMARPHVENEQGNFIFPHRLANGEIRTVEVLSSLINVSRGTLLFSIIHDVTERKRTESVNMARLRLLQFAAAHPLSELLEATLDEAEVLTGSLIAFYHFLEADQKTLSLQNWSTRTKKEFCTAQGPGLHYDVSEAGVWVDCIHQRRPVIHNDYASLTHRKGLPPGHAPVVRELVVPVFRGESIVAILGVGNKPRDYTPEDVESVSHLADLCWEIAVNKRAEEELRTLNEELEQRVKKRTAELERKNTELEKMNRLFVGRELRMVELKEKIRELETHDRPHEEEI